MVDATNNVSQPSAQARIAQLTSDLYPQKTAETITAINTLIEQYASKINVPDDATLFDQTDTILITYGDSLHAPDEAPLKTLSRFANTYLKAAIKTIHILPFYPYSSDDGFSVQDYYAVHPEMGTWEDIVQLGKNYGLTFDAVFNHMSAQSDWFRSFLAGDPEYANLFMTESPDTDLSLTTRPRQSPLLTPFTTASGETIHVWTTFSADQVDFDIREPKTLLRLLDVLLFYVAQGASTIRLDAIAFLWKVAGTTSLHLPQTHAVIQLMRAVLDVVAPHVIIITETNVPHEENLSYFGNGHNEAQMVYNFTLPPLLFYSFLTGNASKLRDWVNSLQAPSDRTTFFNFTASHDGIGLRPVEGILNDEELALMAAHVARTGGNISYRRRPDGTDTPYELNVTYVDAIIDAEEPQALQVKRFVASQAIAMSLAGVPAIYIHSLLGSKNDISGMEASGVNRRINRAKLDYTKLAHELSEENNFRAQVYHAYIKLLKKRQTLAAFHPNAAQVAIDLGHQAVFALLRTSSTQKLLTVFNLSATEISLDLSAYYEDVATDALTDHVYDRQITLQPYACLWLIIA